MKFVFDIRNESNKEGFLIVGIQLAHPQPQFIMNEHPFVFGERPHIWEKSKKFSIFLDYNKVLLPDRVNGRREAVAQLWDETHIKIIFQKRVFHKKYM